MSERRDPSANPPARPAETAPGEGFVQRWSRRKREAELESAQASAEAIAAPQSSEPAVAPPPALTDADMPPVESLDEHSDYSLFLSPGVSDALRRKALDKLFRLPQFGERCALDGEFYDCTYVEPLGSIITYDMREEMKRAAEKLAEVLKPAPEPDKTAAGTSFQIPAEVPRPSVATEMATATEVHDQADKPVARRRRRTRRTT